MTSTCFVHLEPDELFFRDVKISQAYTQIVRVTNTLRGPVELSIKPGSSDRYTVVPNQLRLKADESSAVEVRLRVIRFAQKQKAVEQGQKDVFHIKGSHFDQKFYATFWLSPEADQTAKPKPGLQLSGVSGQERISRVLSSSSPPRRSPPASPPRARKPISKSVSFAADFHSPRSSSARSAFGDDTDAAGPWHHTTTSAFADPYADPSSSPGSSGSPAAAPAQRSAGAQRALAGMYSPQRSTQSYAALHGAPSRPQSTSQRDLLDRSASDSAAATGSGFLDSPRSGQSQPARLAVSASIDFGQLSTGASIRGSAVARGQIHGRAPGSPDARAYGSGGVVGGCGPSRPPKVPSRSLPGSPGRDPGLESPWPPTSPTARPAVVSPARHPAGSSAPSRSTAAGAEGPAGSGAAGRNSPPRALLQGQPGGGSPPGRWASPPRSVGSRESGGLGRGTSPDRAGRTMRAHVAAGGSASPRDEGQPRRTVMPVPYRSSYDDGEAGGSKARSTEGARRRPQDVRRVMQEEDGPTRQFYEDAARALSLHPGRDSLQALGGPSGGGSRERSESPGRRPPGSSSPGRTRTSGSPVRSGARSPGTRPGVRSPTVNARQEDRPRSRSRSPDVQLRPPPRTQLASSPVRRSGVAHTGGIDRSPRGRDAGRVAGGAGQIGGVVRRLSSEGVPSRSRSPRAGGGSGSSRKSSPQRLGGSQPAGSQARIAAPAAGREARSGDAFALQVRLQSLERQQASLRLTVEQQREALGDSAALVQGLQQQLQRAQAKLEAVSAANAGACTDSTAATDQLAAERSGLLEARAALADAEAALAASRQEVAGLRKLQLELQSRQPEVTRAVEAALLQEQAQQDERNRKALELLLSRDERIKELEQQIDEVQASRRELQGQVAELQGRLQAAEAQVLDVLRQKAALVEASEQERRQADKIITELESRLVASECLSAELQAMQDRAVEDEARLAEAERRAAEAEERAALAAARAGGLEVVRGMVETERDDEMEAAVESLRTRSAALQRQHEEGMRLQEDRHRHQVSELQARISDLTLELSRALSGPASRTGKASAANETLEGLEYDEDGADLEGDGFVAVHPARHRGGAHGAIASDPRDIIAAMSGGRGPSSGSGAGKAQPTGTPAGNRGVDRGGGSDLQAANARLAQEVQALRQQLAESSVHSKERLWEQAELDRLRSLISERDIEVAELSSQLEVVKARLAAATAATAPRGGQGSVPSRRTTPAASPTASPSLAGRLKSPARGRPQQQPVAGPGGARRTAEDELCGKVVEGAEAAAVIEALRSQLAKSEASLRGAQERLALIEARAAVAQESAGKGAAQLVSAQRHVVGSTLEQQRLQQELESARATANRLNGRINDLVLAEQVARAEVEAARAKLGQLQELHTVEVSGLQERLQRLSEHLAATQPEVLSVLLGQDYVIASVPTASAAPDAAFDPSSGHDGRAQSHASRTALPLAMPVPGGSNGPSSAALSRERELEKAVDAAETAVAVMQDRLLAALKAAADAGEEAARVRREAEWERDRLEAEVRSAREEGSLRIRSLEETVSRLGARGGEAAQALARAMAEADAAARRESRLRSEMGLAQQAAQRSNTQAAELRLQLRDCEQALREAQVYGGLLLGVPRNAPDEEGSGEGTMQGMVSAGAGTRSDDFTQGGGVGHYRGGVGGSMSHQGPALSAQVEEKLRQQAVELGRRQQVIARLVEVAERAQAEAADTQAELNVLKQAMPDPKSHLHQQYAELQRRLGATEAELRTCREGKAMVDLEVSCLQQQLAERAREVETAAERLAACEREVAAKEEAAARGSVEVRGAMSKEVSLLSRRAAEARRAVDEAESRARELDTQLGNLRAELAEARAELDAQAAESRQLRLRGREEKRAGEEALRQAKRSADVAKQEAQERRSQLTLMMETIEVLQAGNPGEREQRIVSLTAQLSAMTSRESLAEQRAQSLLADAEASASRVQQLQSEVHDLAHQVARLEQQLAASGSNRIMVEGELAAARSDLRARDAAALRTARELDDRGQRVSVLEGELEALRRALNDCQSRHVDQLAREREEAGAAVRQARAESSAAAAAVSQTARLERFQATLEDLVSWVESRTQPQQQSQQRHQPTEAEAPRGEEPGNTDAAASTEALAPGTSWLIAAMHRLKALAMDSEREFLAASTDARQYRSETRWAWSRVQRLQWALEQRTGEWQVAQARVQLLERAMCRRSEEAAVHAMELATLQDKHVVAITDRLQATTSKLVVATSQAVGAEAALAAARATAAALQRLVTVAAAERNALQARLAAADMEAAGTPEAVHLGAEAALAQRDLAIRQYLDGQMAALLAKPDVKDKVMTLAREVCGLKLSESQLQAALAAAKHRGDAASQLAASLTAALRAAEDMVDQVLSQQLAVAPTAGALLNNDATAGGGGNGASSLPFLQPAGAASVAGGLSIDVARLSAQLAAQSHELFRLQEAALRAKQAFDRRESDMEELQAQLAAAELLLTQARSEGSTALVVLRQQLGEVHEQDRQLLLREIRELQDRLAATRDLASKDMEMAEQRIAEITRAADEEVEKRITAALAGQVDAAQLHEVEARAARAESRVTHLESEVAALQEALTAAEAQVVELQDIRDVTGSAVASLEATLVRIEKSVSLSASGAGAAGGRTAGGLSSGARRVPVSGLQSGQGGASGGAQSSEPQPPQGLAGLSRELVRAKMTEAEAVRKMRASARGEVDLRQKLLQRDERISQLKEQLASKTRALEDLRRRMGLPDAPVAPRGGPGPGPGGPGGPGGACRASLRSRSPSPSRAGQVAAAASQSRPGTSGPHRRSSSTEPPSTSGGEALRTSDDSEPESLPTGDRYLAEEMAQLRIELAKRQAEVERLHGALAEANAAAMVWGEPSRPGAAAPGKPVGQGSKAAVVDRLKDQLATANAEIASALSTANSLLLRLDHLSGLPPGSGITAVARRSTSPVRRAASAAGAPLPPDSQLSPGTLAGVMQQLSAALQQLMNARQASAGMVAAAPPLPGADMPQTQGPNPSVDELRQLHLECARLERQRDELMARCSQLEGELEQCHGLVQKLRLSAGGSSSGYPGPATDQGRVPSPPAAGASAAFATPVSSSLGLTAGDPGPITFSAIPGRPGTDAAGGGLPHPGAGRPQRYGPPSSECTPAATASWDSLLLSSATGMGTTGAHATHGSSFGGAGPDGHAEATLSEQQPQVQQQQQQGLQPSASTARSREVDAAVQTSGSAPFALTHAQATTLATAAAKHKARADKWKQRSKELGAQLGLVNASLAAREAAVSERHTASVRHLEEELRTCRDEAARLRAALSGAEAARRELESAAAGSSGHSDGSSASADPDGSQALLARAAEATARAATLERQLEEERAQGAAAALAHQEEVSVLKAAVAQEKGERARLLASLRESLGSAQQVGDAGARLRNEALEAHAATAAARAAAERSEEMAATWRAEAEDLRQRLHQAERVHVQMLAGLESRLAEAERRAGELGATASGRLAAVGARLEAVQAGVAAGPEAVEASLREVEAALRGMQAREEAARQAALSEVQAGRWDALTRIARYQATIKQLQAELQQRKDEWEQERATLQAAADEAVRRSEAVTGDLAELRLQMADLQKAVDEDRQQMAARHRQELQQRLHQERMLAEEAIARAETAMVASERASQQAAAARVEELQVDFVRRLGQLEAARGDLVRELEAVQAQFRQYQAQKAAEVALLEHRIRGFIVGRRPTSASASRRASGASDGADTEPPPPGNPRDSAAASGRGRSNSRGRSPGAGRVPSGLPRARGAAHSVRAGGAGGGVGSAAAATISGRSLLRRAGRGRAATAPAAAVRRRGLGLPGSLLASSGELSEAEEEDPTDAARASGHASCPGAGNVPPQGASGGAGSAVPGVAGPSGAYGGGGGGLAPSQLVALARDSEALVAAQREVAFERALRGRVEAQLGVLRGVVARLRAKLRTASEKLEVARARAIPQEEHRQLQTELSACREQLKNARADSARRQKALQVLQNMALARSGTDVPTASGPGTSAAAAAGAVVGMRARTGRFATAPSAGPGSSLRGSLPMAGGGTGPPGMSASVTLGATGFGASFLDSMDGLGGHTAAGGGDNHAAAALAAAAAAAAAAAGGEYDPLSAALEAAAANARATAGVLEVERAARQAAEVKLKEAKATAERKSALIKELKRRTEELELVVQKHAATAGEEASAEARARSLAATLARKDVLIRELRERLDAAQASVAAGSAAAEAGGEDLEAARRANTKLRAELAKRDAALRTALGDLHKERQLLSAATKQLDLMTRREAATRRTTTASSDALRRRMAELVEALRGLSRVLLQAIAAMDAAAERLSRAAAGGGAAAPTAPRGGAGAIAAAAALMSAQDISALTSLSIEDVQHLLGPEDTTGLLGAGGGDKAAAAATLRVARRVGELLSAVELALAATANAVAASQAEVQNPAEDEALGDEELLRDQLMEAVASAADPAAAAAAVLSSRGRQMGRTLATIAAAAAGVETAVSVRRGGGGDGAPRGSGRAGVASGGFSGSDNLWDSRTLLVLVEEVQAEAQRAEYDLATALREVGVL